VTTPITSSSDVFSPVVVGGECDLSVSSYVLL
jgi:hypothetical protein